MPSKVSPGHVAKPAIGASAALRVETERLIAKERYKDAVKQAKLTFKEEASPENHRLLEQAYFLRARQLLQQGMRTSAVEVAQHLLDFGVTSSGSVEELVRLLIALGFEKHALQIQERLGSPELKQQLGALAADRVVIHPESAGPALPELARDAGLVRQALEKLQAGDEEGAMVVLRDLPRSSPLSEWKLFVRGLAAFYRQDQAEIRANWDRLDPKRTAAAIAQRLRRMSAESTGTDSNALEPMEKLVFGEPILDRLQQVRTFAANHEWPKVLRLIGPLRHALNQIDPKLAERLTVVLIGSLIKSVQDMTWTETERVITQFTRVAQPMTIDPRWNRLWAIVWDGPQADDISGTIRHWVQYIQDLETIASLSPPERALAQAIVWGHVAGLNNEDVEFLMEELEGLPSSPFKLPGHRKKGETTNDPDLAAAKKEVIDCLERGIRLAPTYLPNYKLLVEFHAEWKDARGMEAAAKRLLAAFPDNTDALELLGRHHFQKNDLAAALPYIQRARRTKPLDASLRSLEWMIRVGLARLFAISKKWDEGRAEFAAADELLPEYLHQYGYLARKAIFEHKAGQAGPSDRYLEEARAQLVEPAPLWLALVIESIRYHMPKSSLDAYTKLWEADQKKKVRSETAGVLAGQMEGFLAAGIEYPNRDTHIDQVVAYLKRTMRLKYRREDIEQVVEFLTRLPDQFDLLEKLVKAGLKQHPDSASLNMRAADVEMTKGQGFAGTRSAQRYLETALKLAEASTDPKVTELLPVIRKHLGVISELTERMGPFGFPFGGGMPFGPDFLDALDFEDDDEYDDEFDGDDDGPVFGRFPSPRPAPKGASSKGKKKKKKK
jgi:tetratricopeptide (TPR) repeat protein